MKCTYFINNFELKKVIREHVCQGRTTVKAYHDQKYDALMSSYFEKTNTQPTKAKLRRTLKNFNSLFFSNFFFCRSQRVDDSSIKTLLVT